MWNYTVAQYILDFHINSVIDGTPNVKTVKKYVPNTLFYQIYGSLNFVSVDLELLYQSMYHTVSKVKRNTECDAYMYV